MELISDVLITNRYSRARKDTEKVNQVKQKPEMPTAYGKIK